MKITQKQRIVLKILGYRCCLTCKYFNRKYNYCSIFNSSSFSDLFDLRKNPPLEGESKLEKLLRIGSKCPSWKAFETRKREDER